MLQPIELKQTIRIDPLNEIIKMKQCSQCHQTKPADAFNVRRAGRDGLQARCRVCAYAAARAWKAANPDKVRASAATWRSAHGKAWREANPAAMASYANTANAKREVGAEASPPDPMIDAVYADAKAAGQHVDHCIPLSGCRVCGAQGQHVLANLQIITPAENRSKGNRCMECWAQAPQLAEQAEQAAEANRRTRVLEKFLTFMQTHSPLLEQSFQSS